MRRNLIILNFILMGISVFFLFIKLFTVEIGFPDDPTVELILRSKPALVSRIIVRNVQDYPSGYKRILTDENGFIGEDIYHFIIEAGWIALPVLWIFTTGILFFNRQRKQRN